MTAHKPPRSEGPRSPALQVVVALVALFFVCGTCNSCDRPSPAVRDAVAAPLP
jgi:hypothetical protein